MNLLQDFKDKDFIDAVQAFFTNLNVPFNLISDLQTEAKNVIGDKKCNENIAAIYPFGIVTDAIFNKKEIKISQADLKNKKYEGILLFGVELSKEKPSRSDLAEITRQINREFSKTPVVVVFKYAEQLTFANAERIDYSQTWREGEKVGKVSMLKDIVIENPHRAHQDILSELGKQKAKTFEELYEYWQNVLNTKALNKQFFKKIANWYFLAVDRSKFPFEYLKNDPKLKDKTNEELQELANQKAIIRFITRIIFVWFLKEKKLIPDSLFDKEYIDAILEKSDSDSNYYNAILQNLFFATLNKPKEARQFALDKGFHKNRSTDYDQNSLYRYEKMFKDENPENIMKYFKNIPFLNGGLFDSLDSKEKDDQIIIDGFSRNEKWQAQMPDYLLFEKNEIDFDKELQAKYASKKGHYEVKGLFSIFNEYKFTIEENTPLETDVALDPYLLGEIFENLLAYYNPETGTTARKGSGSFYTPQEIVNYMVTESLNAYLDTKLDFDFKTLAVNEFSKQQKIDLVTALSEIKILDPACGSGAFPMGVLYNMVDTLKTIDSDNSIWKQIQHDKIIGSKIAELEADKKAIKGLSDIQVKQRATKAVEDRLNELESIFNNEYNFDDYARKLYIIQNCIYGVDIQDVAIQISKLRFFLSLIVDQKNDDIKPLPNLETKFVIANTLIALNISKEDLFNNADVKSNIHLILSEIKKIRVKYFNAATRQQKQSLKQEDQNLRNNLALIIEHQLIDKRENDIELIEKGLLKANELLASINTQPEDIEIIESTDLFGQKSKQKINKRKEKLKIQQEFIKNQTNRLNALNQNFDKEEIKATAKKIVDFDPFNPSASADWFDMEWMFGIEDGFDVVIGNPPYIKEYTDKSVFEGLRDSPYYQGKMDLWYFFTCVGIDLLKQNGSLCFIAPNNWTTNSGASKLRNKIINDTKIKKLIDFNNYMIFESASIQTMVMLFKKNVENDSYKFDLRKINSEKPTFDDVLNLINGNKSDENIILEASIVRVDTLDSILTFTNNKNEKILEKIKLKSNFTLDKKKEVAQGIVYPQDYLNKKNQILLGSNFSVGQGVFALSNIEKESLNLNEKENELIKPYFSTEHLFKWNANPINTNWIIYTDSKFKNRENIKPYPNLKRHLDQFQKIITSDNKPYGLHRARDEYFFKDEKIIVLRKCVNEPKFTYTDFDSYVSATFYVIKTERLNQKYLISLLNSKLVAFWLKYKGKMQGNNYQLDKAPLLAIPIFNSVSQQPFIALVNQILEGKKQGADTSILEHQIDVMVYHLYELSYEEACVIDKNLSKTDFERYNLNP